MFTFTMRPDRALAPHCHFAKQALAQYGNDAVEIFHTDGATGLAAYAQNLEKEAGTQLYLFDGEKGPLSGRIVTAEIFDVIKSLQQKRSRKIFHSREENWIAGFLPRYRDNNYIIVLSLPKLSPPPLRLLIKGRHIWLRILIFLAVAGIVCFLLSRSLTSPIRKLREATQRFAGGDFSARVGQGLGKKGNETAELSRDFDMMAERIEELMTSQKRLLRDISHELRSPLARLNVALELARQRSGPEASDSLARIEQESERLNELIGQLLTLTLLESGGRKLDKEPVDLAMLVKDIVKDADFEARNKKRSVTFTDIENISLNCSWEMMRRAIENVVRNAVHYTDEETVVEVKLLARQDNGDHALIQVRDHGPGVPQQALTHIFEPFYRVAEARDRQSGGTGIGLAIADRAIRLHGGSVTAVNAKDGGLIVEIILPYSDHNLIKI